jgi:hypothetical protein
VTNRRRRSTQEPQACGFSNFLGNFPPLLIRRFLSSGIGATDMSATIHVIATTFDGTAAALKAVTPVATSHHARVVLLVPQTPGAEQAEQSPLAIPRLVARYDEVAKRLHQPVQIRVCLGPDVTEAAKRMTPNGATVFIGGRASLFWPSAEERLAARLRRSGREVVFIGCNSGRAGGGARARWPEPPPDDRHA